MGVFEHPEHQWIDATGSGVQRRERGAHVIALYKSTFTYLLTLSILLLETRVLESFLTGYYFNHFGFYSASALLAIQSAVIARGIPSVRHVPVLCPDE